MTNLVKELPSTGAEIRALAREGVWSHPTAGVAADFVQANLAILPANLAFEFLLFCQRNPKPCPVIEVIENGLLSAKLSAPGSDVSTDAPLYRVYRRGELVDEPVNIKAWWRDDLVTFLLGCSFTFEHALIRNGIRLPHYDKGGNVSMFVTNIQTVPAGPFAGPMVVTQRWIPSDKVVRAVQATSRFPSVHGSPVHIGDPSAIGIEDPLKPDFGDSWQPYDKDDVPVYWACGVTPQAIAMNSKPELMITHAPGHMFVTDMRDEELAVI